MSAIEPISALFLNHGLRGFPLPPSEDRALGLFAGPSDPDHVFLAVLPAAGRQTPSSAPSWYSPAFFPSPSAGGWFPALHVEKVLRKDFRRLLQALRARQPEGLWAAPDDAVQRFTQRTSRLLQNIREGQLRKGVPFSFLGRENPKKHYFEADELTFLLRNALDFQENSGGMLYGLWNLSRGILGVSPETLFELQGEELSTMALAGTRPVETESIEAVAASLLADPKERAEHQCVIEGICESLAGLGHLQVGPTGTRRAGRLLHLHTPLTLKFDRLPEWKILVDRLHPTPALGALPREAGWKWLEQFENDLPRGRFGAPWGVRLPEMEHCLVAIRNIEWNHEEGFCRIGAGAGVVEGSVPEREWAEVERKWNSVLQIFGLRSKTSV